MRILLGGMRRLGLGLELPAQSYRGAHASLVDKRQLVTSVVAQAGWAQLLKLGCGVADLLDDPIHQGLIRARDPADFMRRWARLERHIHSHHYLSVQIDNRCAKFAHLSARDSVPGAGEDFAVLAVLIGSFEAIGVREVRATVAGVPVYPDGDETAIQALVANAQTGDWTIEWQPGPARVRPRQAACPVNLCAPLRWPELPDRIAEFLCDDPAHTLTVSAVAAHFSLSVRQLQRQLQRDQLNYSAIVTEVRTRCAAWWLLESEVTPAEIAFVCGYTDQAHFTRQFKVQTGMPPARYRRAFRSGQRPHQPVNDLGRHPIDLPGGEPSEPG